MTVSLLHDPSVEMMEVIEDTKTTDTDLTCSSSDIKDDDEKKKKKNRQPMRRKKSVRWNEDVAMRLSLHVNEYTDDEFFGTWYQPREFEKMKRSAMKEQCPIRLRTKIMVRQAVTDALLNEQYRQYYEQQRQYNNNNNNSIRRSTLNYCHDENDEDDNNVLALAAVCRMASVRAYRQAMAARTPIAGAGGVGGRAASIVANNTANNNTTTTLDDDEHRRHRTIGQFLS